MSIDECGRYRPECEVSEQKGDSIPRTWKCSSKCKPKKLVSYLTKDDLSNTLYWQSK